MNTLNMSSISTLKIVFAGTPAFGLPSLEAIFQSHHTLQAVYTQPDRPAGRGRTLQASAVKTWAQAHHLPIYQPLHFKEPNSIATLSEQKPDVLVVIAYGLILPQTVLSIPTFGCINVHASLLPRWRGASPIQQSLLQGDAQTGITIMQMDAGMDTGAILTQTKCPIQSHDTSSSLHDALAQLAVQPLLETLDAIALGRAHATPQSSEGITHAPKIKKEDARIDWHQPVEVIDRMIRAYQPWPVAYTHLEGAVLRIHQARIEPHHHSALPGTLLSVDKEGLLIATKTDALRIERLQSAGSTVMSVRDWLNAKRTLLPTYTMFT